MLHFDNVSLRRGPRLLFEGASFQVHPGHRVGVTGANGTGKSSLFAMVLKTLASDAGEISRPAGWVIAHLAQEIPATRQEAIEYVLDGDAGLRQLQQQLAQAEATGNGEQIAHLHAELEHVGGYQANSRAAQLMAGLGFRPDFDSSTDMTPIVSPFSSIILTKRLSSGCHLSSCSGTGLVP